MEYKKKPVIIEAFQYDGDLKNSKGEWCVPEWAIKAFENGIMFYEEYNQEPSELFIKTLEGKHHVSVNDYVIKGVHGELYPCKPDIFEETYEVVKQEPTKHDLLKAIDDIQNEYDAYLMLNRHSWGEDENTHGKQFKLLMDAKLNGDKVQNALAWIHDCYDCYYKHDIEANEDNPFTYLRNVIEDQKLIYSFDFDGTIVINKFPEIGEVIQPTVDFIKKIKEDGHYIILNTMRENEHLLKALMFCKGLGIKFDAVNDNLPHMKEFYKNNPRKIFANYYIDDHNMFLEGVNYSERTRKN